MFCWPAAGAHASGGAPAGLQGARALAFQSAAAGARAPPPPRASCALRRRAPLVPMRALMQAALGAVWPRGRARLARGGFAVRAAAGGANGGGATAGDEDAASAAASAALEAMGNALATPPPRADDDLKAMHGALVEAFQEAAGGKASKAAAGKPLKNLKLLDIDGVGQANETLLQKRGVDSVLKLTEIYHSDRIGARSDTFVDYLMGEVKIKYSHHAKAIARHVDSLCVDEVEEALRTAAKGSANDDRLTFCVEGNIAVGKTTFLEKVVRDQACVMLTELVDIVPEPVGEWKEVQGVEFDPNNLALTRNKAEKYNLLDAFYAQPERFAYTFQNYVFVTRMLQNQRSAENWRNPLRLLERSVFSDRMVFVRAVHEAKWMSELELAVYESWFAPVVSAMPGLIPDGFIYLRAEPSTCFNRKNIRSRLEEDGVDLGYLTQLHEKHEQWLSKGDDLRPTFIQGGPTTHSGLSAASSLDDLGPRAHDLFGGDDVPDLIRGKMKYLSAQSHPLCAGVPTLILDYDPQLDLDHDVEAKKEYAAQVRCFYEHVRNLKRRLVVPAPPDAVHRLGRREHAA